MRSQGSLNRPLRERLSRVALGLGVCIGACLGVGCSGPDAPPGPGAEPPVDELPPESCGAPDLVDVRRLPVCSDGSGSFGRWTIDRLGLPAYDYVLDQHRDGRARYPNTEQRDRREHWHAFGNDRINALFFNDGYVQVFTQDRGATWLNLFSEETQDYAGGFSYLSDGEEAWSTAYRYRPAGSRARRRFGTGYAEGELVHRGVRVLRRIFAPRGDVPGVVADVTIENLGERPRALRHYEYWDVGRVQLRADWLASGRLNPRLPGLLLQKRAALGAYFDETPRWDAASRTLAITRSLSPTGAAALPAATEVSDLDVRPGDPRLVALIGPVAAAYTEQAAFFGGGGPARPDAVVAGAPADIGPSKSGAGQPHLLVLRSDLSLLPGESTHLRFFYGTGAFGATPPPLPVELPAALYDPEPDGPWQTSTQALGRELFFLQTPRAPWLGRELAWHAGQLLGSVGYREYFGRHVVPQGSAYLYLHGVDGAPRDLALFTLPLVYLRPALAREVIELTCGLVHRDDGRLSYSFHGHGFLDDALIHSAPSDLYLFLFLAVSEYVAATGDYALLAAPVLPHPADAGPALPVREHLRRGARHLLDTIGTGAHGLLRVQTGDWSDGILLSARDRNLAVKNGESVPNSQMAVYVLPRLAALLRPEEPTLADELVRKAQALQAALRPSLAGDFFLRAYFNDGSAPFGSDHMHLEAQVWPLIAGGAGGAGGLLDEAQRRRLLAASAARLEARSPIGAFVIEPTGGDPAAGQAWPAVNGLLTWGYARAALASGPAVDRAAAAERAFAALTAMTLRAHARAFPDLWAGIWSAADGSWGTSGGDAPGASWSSEVTPMTDFPVMNNNAHAMPLLAALRLAGIEPLDDGTGLRIAPLPVRDAGEALALDTPLLQLALSPGRVRGAYRPVTSGARSIEIAAPPGHTVTAAQLDGRDVAVAPRSQQVRLSFAAQRGREVAFEVRTAAVP
ncbi:MAG: hypothetical protein U1A78_00440 [Polyangia bacterium]